MIAVLCHGAFAASAQKCRVSDLQACLDSACDDGLDTASRCYLCGTSAAKKPEEKKYALGDTPKLQSLAVGRSSRNTLSDNELKSAPKEPGERYQWATRECVKKIDGCAAEDATENYDKLIDQSCKVALGDVEYTASIKNSAVKKTSDQCSAELSSCLLSPAKCDGNMLKCADDAEFNRNFSSCMADASGCGDFITEMRGKMISARDNMVKTRESRLTDLANLRKMERQEKLESANRLCSGVGKDACVAEMCGNMPNGLDENGLCADQNERQWAANLCKFVDTACNKLK
jgi:hypothetical protein